MNSTNDLWEWEWTWPNFLWHCSQGGSQVDVSNSIHELLSARMDTENSNLSQSRFYNKMHFISLPKDWQQKHPAETVLETKIQEIEK